MAGRPRKASDAALIAAAARALHRLGPAGLTLAAAGAEAGVRASTLALRFGSKRGLLLAVAAAGAEGVPAHFAAARAGAADPRAALLAAYRGLAAGLETPAAVANGLAFLHLDLTDPEFRALARAHQAAVLAETAALLAEAGLPEAAAAALHALYGGTLIAWAVDGEGGLPERLDAALGGYLAALAAAAGTGLPITE
ncbi:MAG TPA: TetR family transcriptional regulator [Alphaproteobacteria bacterium]|nr:TetR family transcriptional regulator [Alphaproteobacteria bacterium]